MVKSVKEGVVNSRTNPMTLREAIAVIQKELGLTKVIFSAVFSSTE